MKRVRLTYEMDSREIHRLVNDGFQLTCIKCNSDLEVALSSEQAREQQIKVGIFCPKDEAHVGILFELADTHLTMRNLFANMQETWAKEQKEEK
jgi:hypothetical protein